MKRLVVKIGSNILANGRTGLDVNRINSLCWDISELIALSYDVVVVSSGAIAAGIKKLGLKSKPADIRLKQAAAAIGQSSLMWAYERGFAEFGRKVAQVLITKEDFSDRKRYINTKNTLLTLLSYGIIPIINENDTVSTDEIKFGDNDNLASLVSILVEADRLIILSDVEGLYSQDPGINAKAGLVRYVEEITTAIEKMAGSAGSSVGSGGMYTKVIAAGIATSHGIQVNIISGKKKGILSETVQGGQHGTLFSPAKSRLSKRKGWLTYSARSRGTVKLDNGAARAIVEKGGSLLPSGIISVEGNFDVGDSVSCLDAEGNRIAKGLSNYSAHDINKIRGHKTSEIEKILGYKYSDEVIHRDNLALL
ncbi:MAG: glutamate 5-kinase [Nitrospirota bacterium]|nr:glutamate 5-kinase [Nitrospirota bacterium]